MFSNVWLASGCQFSEITAFWDRFNFVGSSFLGTLQKHCSKEFTRTHESLRQIYRFYLDLKWCCINVYRKMSTLIGWLMSMYKSWTHNCTKRPPPNTPLVIFFLIDSCCFSLVLSYHLSSSAFSVHLQIHLQTQHSQAHLRNSVLGISGS